MKHSDLTDWNIRTRRNQKEADIALSLERIRNAETELIYLSESGTFIGNNERFDRMINSMFAETNNFLKKTLDI